MMGVSWVDRLKALQGSKMKAVLIFEQWASMKHHNSDGKLAG
jgi:hypothetical protein